MKNRFKNFLNEYILYIYMGLIILCTIATIISTDKESIIIWGWMPLISLTVGFLTGLYTNESPKLFKNPLVYKIYNEKLKKCGTTIAIISSGVTLLTITKMIQEPNIINVICTTLSFNLSFIIIIATINAKNNK